MTFCVFALKQGVTSNRYQSIPKFEVGKSAWITLPRKGSIEVKIDSRMKDASGKFVYQVKDAKSGMLHKGGVWVAQEDLSEF